VHPEADRAAVTAQLVRGLRALAGEHQASGIHTLCCLDRDAAALEAAGHLRRTTHQYHWRNDGYRDFEHFLAALRSEARKQIRKERRRIGEQGVTVVLKQGLEVTADDWALLDRLYRVHSSGKWGAPRT
jgi:predicted N-acyltransferase